MISQLYDHVYTDDMMDILISHEQERIKSWEDELKGLPEGSLCHSITAGKVYYSQCIDGRKRSISHETDTLYGLARKKYLRARIAEQRKKAYNTSLRVKSLSNRPPHSSRIESHIMGSLINDDYSAVQRLLLKFSNLGLDLQRITCSKDQYRWINGNYLKSRQELHNCIYETYSGVKVRSKSEQSIGNLLELNGIPYRYEQGFEFDVSWMEGVTGTSMGQYKVYYPDFTIQTVTGECILWEHLGRTDLPGYRTHNMEKIAAYRQDGRFTDSRLILTFERDMESTKIIADIISQRIMPYV